MALKSVFATQKRHNERVFNLGFSLRIDFILKQWKEVRDCQISLEEARRTDKPSENKKSYLSTNPRSTLKNQSIISIHKTRILSKLWAKFLSQILRYYWYNSIKLIRNIKIVFIWAFLFRYIKFHYNCEKNCNFRGNFQLFFMIWAAFTGKM